MDKAIEEEEKVVDEIIEEVVEEVEPDGGAEAKAESQEGEDVEGEVVVSFSDEVEEEKEDEGTDTRRFKELRKKTREQAKRIKEFEERDAATQTQAQPLGEKPTLEGADYDGELYAQQLEGWLGQKQQIDYDNWQQQEQQNEQNRAWQGRLNEYDNAAKDFEADGYKEAEDIVKTAMDGVQQGQMVHILGAQLAPLIMGLARNHTKLQALAEIKDTSLFAAAIGKLEGKMTVSKRKAATTPEPRLSPSAGGSGATTSSHLDALREKAAKTGDLTEVMAYKARMRREAS